MLALTVMLAAVAVPLVLSQSGQIEEERPDVDFAFAYTEDVELDEEDSLGATGEPDPAGVDADGKLTVVLETGESVPAEQLNISGAASSGNLASDDSEFEESDDISAGTPVTVWAERGDTVQVRWESPDGEKSSILGEFTIRPVE